MAASAVRSGAGRANRYSRARCTSVPLVAAAEGGSLSPSIAESRNASAQSENDDNFEGERVAGGTSAMDEPYPGGTTGSSDPGCRLPHLDRIPGVDGSRPLQRSLQRSERASG